MVVVEQVPRCDQVVAINYIKLNVPQISSTTQASLSCSNTTGEQRDGPRWHHQVFQPDLLDATRYDYATKTKMIVCCQCSHEYIDFLATYYISSFPPDP